MHEQLARLLQRSEPIGTFTTKWGDGTIDLLVADYLSAKLPPTELIMSVRAVLLRGQEVLVVSEPNGPYILPGGRREAGETLLQTLQR
jgi:8-oxo-dGTP pyrophosphatase MutT (NUDIX family)